MVKVIFYFEPEISSAILLWFAQIISIERMAFGVLSVNPYLEFTY